MDSFDASWATRYTRGVPSMGPLLAILRHNTLPWRGMARERMPCRGVHHREATDEREIKLPRVAQSPFSQSGYGRSETKAATEEVTFPIFQTYTGTHTGAQIQTGPAIDFPGSPGHSLDLLPGDFWECVRFRRNWLHVFSGQFVKSPRKIDHLSYVPNTHRTRTDPDWSGH